MPVRRGPKRLLSTLALLIVLLAIPGSRPQATETGVQQTSSAAVDSALSQLTNYPTTDGVPPPNIYTSSYLLLDAQSATVIAGHNIHQQLPIASTTKMTAALVAVQLLKPTDLITVYQQAIDVGGSSADLQAGEQFTLSDMLKAMLIPSGNDAAYSLAFAYSHDPNNYQMFVDQMNKFAVERHLVDTHFADPSGLNDDGHSSVFDLAMIARLVLANPILKQIVDTPSTTIISKSGNYYPLTNSNHLILPDDPYYLPGTLGVKTGNTDAAGHCLVSAYKVNGRLLVGALLHTNENTIYATAIEMTKLFNWASQYVVFNSY